MILSRDKRVRQEGMAIITIMLVVALMVTLLGFIIEKQHILTRRMENQASAERIYQMALGVENWAQQFLLKDHDLAKDYTRESWGRLTESWELQKRRLEEPENEELFEEDDSIIPYINLGISGGSVVKVEIIDLQGRYNLNNLFAKDKDVDPKAQQTIYTNLLKHLKIGDHQQRLELYGTLYDWLDENDHRSRVGKGYESGDYRSNDKTPYYAANQPLTTFGELKFVHGYTDKVINSLALYVTVLPTSDARVNINTVSAEVLSSLSLGPDVNVGGVDSFLGERDHKGFSGYDDSIINDVEELLIQQALVPITIIPDMMQANSQFFQIISQVSLAGTNFELRTDVRRKVVEEGDTRTISIEVINRQKKIL